MTILVIPSRGSRNAIYAYVSMFIRGACEFFQSSPFSLKAEVHLIVANLFVACSRFTILWMQGIHQDFKLCIYQKNEKDTRMSILAFAAVRALKQMFDFVSTIDIAEHFQFY